MPVEYRTGNLFDFEGNLAHGTNAAGAMGKGIAKEFKAKFPGMYTEYVDLCKTGRHQFGMIFPWRSISVKSNAMEVMDAHGPEIKEILKANPAGTEIPTFKMQLRFDMSVRTIYNLCIKPHWKMKAETYAVRATLKRMVEHAVEQQNIKQDSLESDAYTFSKFNSLEIAMPALGCGLGGLDWESEVKPIIEEIGSQTPCTLIVYLQEEATQQNESNIDPHDVNTPG